MDTLLTRPRPSALDTLPVLTYGSPELRDDSVRLLAELAAAGPICRVLPYDVLGVTRFREADAMLRDPGTFSSNVELLPQPPGTARIGALIGDDPPAHTRLRALVGQAFTPDRVATVMAPRVLAIARGLVDRIVASGREFDLVRDLAVPFPVTVISELLGVDPADRPRFTRWSDDVTAATLVHAMPDGPARTQRIAEIDRSLRELDAYLADVVRAYRARPAENLITFMVEAQEGAERLSDEEVLGLAKLLLVAGNETTTKLISNAMHLLVDVPVVWRELGDAPSLIPGAMEEALRIEGPVHHRMRRATRDCVVAGVAVAAGSLVDCVLGAANLDPTVFPDPTRFDIHRKAPRHLAFGGGIHQCVGMPLARLETRIVFEELVSRMATVEATAPATRSEAVGFRGFASMPLRFTPRRTRPPTSVVRPLEAEVAVADRIAERSDHELGLDKRAREIVRVARVRELAEGIRMFRLVHPHGGLLTRFTPGSHIVVHLREGEHVWRNAYSLLNSEFGNGLNYFIAVALDPSGRGGSRYMHDKVTAGMELSVSVPANHFPPAPQAAKHLLVAGGIGITPIFALWNHLLSTGAPVALHYTFRRAAAAAFVEELEVRGDPNVRLYDNALGHTLDVEALVRAQPEGTHVYVCGPEGLMDAVIASAARHGWPKETIHYERFGAPKPKGEAPFEVTCAASGRTLVCGANETLLEALERGGLRVPFSCRAGSCGACEIRVLEGEVEHRDTVLSEEERASGAMLVCVSRGKKKLVLGV